MSSEWRCEGCCRLLGIGFSAEVHLKNKAEQTIVSGKDFVVTQICRRCGTANEVQRPQRS